MDADSVATVVSVSVAMESTSYRRPSVSGLELRAIKVCRTDLDRVRPLAEAIAVGERPIAFFDGGPTPTQSRDRPRLRIALRGLSWTGAGNGAGA